MSLHFETQLVQKEFLIKNNLWTEFEEFKEKKGLKISKFDYVYNGSVLLSLLRKIKLTSYVSIKKYSLKEIDAFANDYRIRDYMSLIHIWSWRRRERCSSGGWVELEKKKISIYTVV
ncbi:hypothetical protein [Mesomycoplasma hyorhinis]|uniref:hypothetical protein n=1 Tax=Mesomycoplasma hyorhinis TaxID=2100 RepID=UPI001F1D1226|nr:hypothetical protein [Mesomycoplasma hyorhinis]